MSPLARASSGGGGRTRTPLSEHRILSPVCLPFHHSAKPEPAYTSSHLEQRKAENTTRQSPKAGSQVVRIVFASFAPWREFISDGGQSLANQANGHCCTDRLADAYNLKTCLDRERSIWIRLVASARSHYRRAASPLFFPSNLNESLLAIAFGYDQHPLRRSR